MNGMSAAEALLKILELGERQVAEGKVHDARAAIAELRRRWQAERSDKRVGD